MISLRNNTPRAVLYGIDDQSRVPILPEFTPVPIHYPLFFIFAAKGPDFASVSPNAATQLYGEETFNVRSKFYTHQTLAMQGAMEMGNQCMVRRITPPDATRASLTVVVTVDKTSPVYQYQRDPDGKVVTDITGVPQFTTDLVTNGILLKYEVVPTTTFEQGIDTDVYDFTPVGPADKRMYPLLSFIPPSVGKYGDNIGIRMWHMGQSTSDPADLDVVNFNQALIYGIQLVERAIDNTNRVTETIKGSRGIAFSFKPGSYDQKTEMDLTIDAVVTEYNDDGRTYGNVPIYGPIKELKVEQDNIDMVLAELMSVETVSSPKTIFSKYMLNLLTATDAEDIAHYGFQLAPDSVKFVESRTHYLRGGSDGTLTNPVYNQQVGIDLDFNYENTDYPLLDIPMFPFSTVYDTGFDLDVKKKFFKWLGRRKDVYVVCSTFIEGHKLLSLAEEISIATTLRAAAAIYAESDFYGTAAVRVMIFGQSGEMINSPYRKRTSMIQDYIRKVADYEGAGKGEFKVKGSFNKYPKSTVTYMKNVSVPHMGEVAKDTAWGTGMNYAQSSDVNELFYAAYQTIYPFKNSILTSAIVMHICCDLEKILYKVWIMCTGDDELSDELFIKKANGAFDGLVAGKYDGRGQLESQTYMTPADKARGFTWHQKAIIRAPVMRTIGLMTVEAQRLVTK